MDFFLFLPQTSTEQDLTARKAPSHSPQHTRAANHGGAAEQQDGSTENIGHPGEQRGGRALAK